MAGDAHPPELNLVLTVNGVEVNLSPLQGLWTARQYLKITELTRQVIEFTDGMLEILPPVTTKHQTIVGFLYRTLYAWIEPIGGNVHLIGLCLRIRKGKFREPDLLLLCDATDTRNQDRYWLGADLVAEVVSCANPERDTVVKQADYAEAGIPEYWIVNPLDETITVLTLAGAAYVEHGVFPRGGTAGSALLPGFALNVADVFDAR